MIYQIGGHNPDRHGTGRQCRTGRAYLQMTSAKPAIKYKRLKSTGSTNTWARLLILSLLCLVVGQIAAAGAAHAASLTVDDVTAVEGAGLLFTVELNGGAGPVTVNVNFTDATATGGPDYDNMVKTLSFAGASGETQTFTVPTSVDTILEGDETFTVNLNASNPQVDDSDTGTGTINDDDAASVTVDDATAVEGADLLFTVSLDNAVAGPFTVTANFIDVTATGGPDYNNAPLNLPFSGMAGEIRTFSIPTGPDTILEGDEIFRVKLNVSNLLVEASDTGTGTINDDDNAAVTVADVSATEGGELVFTVTLENAVADTFDVDVNFTDVTTGGGSDYDIANQILIFAGAAGEQQRFTVLTVEDAVLEGDETFTVNLTAANALVDDSDTATGTINENDTAAVTVEDVTMVEGAGLMFTVTLDNAVAGAFSLDASFTDGTATGAADYGNTIQTLNFAGAAGEQQTFTVLTVEDSVLEGDEHFTVSLTAANAIVDDSDTETGTIIDNETAAVTVDDVIAVEGTGLLFMVSLDNAVSGSFTVVADFTDGTATGGAAPLTAPADYDNTTQALNFAGTAGEIRTFTVNILDDAVLEGTETFTVSLRASNALVDDSDTGDGTILNDDYGVYIGDASAVEGSLAQFTVILDRPVSDADVVVTYNTSNGTATAGTDYTAAAGGSLAISAPDSSGIITISTIPDADDESDETFTVILSNTGLAGDNASIATGTATGTITDNDYTVTFTAAANGNVDVGGVMYPTFSEGIESGGSPSVVTAAPDTGYNFVEWTIINGAGNATISSLTAPTLTITNVQGPVEVQSSSELQTFSITASVVSGNGMLSNAGTQVVTYGSDSTDFMVTPAPCWHIQDVLVDGASIGAVSSIPAFTAVSGDHTVEAVFAVDTYTINASAGANGSLSPSDAVTVDCGTDQTFTITPDTVGGYFSVQDTVVDGVSQGEGVTSYTFTNVTADHTISATFQDFASSCVTAPSVVLNSTTNGSINPAGDNDYIRVDIPAPGGVLTTYTEYTGDRTDTYGYLLDENCNQLAHNDDSGRRLNFRIQRAVSPGTYYIRIRHYSSSRTGTYTLFVEFESDDHGNDCDSATPIICDSATAGRIHPAGNWDYFRLDLANPALVSIRTTGSIDSYGYLLDDICSEIDHDDDSGSSRNFQMEHTLDVGTYHVAVRHYNSSRTGNYTLEVECTSFYMLTASAEYGGSISPAGSIIVAEGNSQAFTITPDAGNAIADVLVDGVSIGAVSNYTFSNVTADHSIVATFAIPPESCVDLSDTPLDVKRHGAPPNIMFVMDDSGSMDWEFMTTNEDGKFNVGGTSYEYLNSLEDNLYKGWSSNATVLSGSNRMYWKSQWSGFNRLYYDPTIEYDHWPTLTDADPDVPRSFPLEAIPTMNMSGTFRSFDGGTATYIVDNQSVSSFEFSSPTVIVDNLDANFTKTTTGGSWSSGTDSQAQQGQYDDTGSDGDYTATWTPDIPVTGNYTVYAHWHAAVTRSEAVPYTVTHSAGTDTIAVDQSANGGQWVALGTYSFDQGTTGKIDIDVTVTDNANESVCADAVKFVLIDGWDWATDSEAQKDHYYWTAKDGFYTATWTPNLVAGEYRVYAKWVHNSTRSTSVPYAINHTGGTTTALVNQQQDDGDWYYLGTYDFDTVAGNVTINYTRNGVNDTVCADAVKFVSTSESVIDIKNAHYYVWSDIESRPYLVIVDGGTIRYWQVNDDGDDYIEEGELLETTAPPNDVRTSRNYVNERQNYANWFQFYRKRDLLTRYAIAKFISSMQGVQIGMRSINGLLIQPVLKVKVGGDDYSSTLLSRLYDYRLEQRSTPLRRGLEHVGRYYDKQDGYDGGVGPSPLADEDEGGSCQQNFAVVFTDGYYNGSSPSVGNADGNNGLPYADTSSDTLADVAMHYYENDLSDNVDNRVPVNPMDDALHQHMVTYGVTFGVHGTMDPDNYDLENCDAATCPSWPSNPRYSSDERHKIDDLWHSSVNGRGTFISATNPLELIDAFNAVMQNIESRIGSAASVSVNGDELYGVLDETVRMYQSSYSSDGWTGDVKAYAVDMATGEVISTSYVFSAAAMLETIDADDRIIVTSDGNGTAMPFRFNSLTETLKELLVADGESGYTNAAHRVEYLRGDRNGLEVQYGGSFRNRYQKLGDIVHSSPVFENGVLYAGGNDGMLHAFSASDGRELFAYVPRLVFHDLKELTSIDYTHRFFVDLTPVARNEVEIAPGNAITLLVGGLGKGGKGYFALDISDPAAIVDEATLASKVMWEYPRTVPATAITGATDASSIVVTAPGHGFITGDSVVVDNVSGNTAANGTWTITVIDADTFSLDSSSGNGAYASGGTATYHDPHAADMGYSYSQPAIIKTNDAGRWVIMFGNGYNSHNGNAVLFILDPADGSVIKTIDTGVGPCNGLSSPTAVDINSDFKVDYAYAGDIKGNLWKFDLTGAVADWDIAFEDGGGTPQPLFQAKDGSNPQPISIKPDVMYHCDRNGVMVLFGTGRYLGEFDFADTSLQTLYGIWDYSDGNDPAEYLGSFERGSTPQLSNQPDNVYLLLQTEVPGTYFGSDGQQLRVTTDYSIDYDITTEAADTSCPDDGTSALGDTPCDPNAVGSQPDPILHAGWYFDLPLTGERVPGNLMIREEKVIVIGFVPEQTPCGSGGDSIVMELNACSGSRLANAQFDINGDGVVDQNDLVPLNDAGGNPILDGDGSPILVAPTGKMYPGRLLPPAVLRTGDEEIKYFSTNVGNIVTMRENAIRLGIIYWQEVMQ